MKKLAIFLCGLAMVLPLAAQNATTDKAASAASSSPAQAAPAATPSTPADVGYALGMLMGQNIKSNGLDTIDVNAFSDGLKAGLAGAAGKFSAEQAQAILQAAVQVAQENKKKATIAASKAFLDTNKKKTGVTVTASGLQYEIITAGKGPKPKVSDTVKVNYEGKLIDGKVFDSSYQRGEPVTFALNSVIPGWIEALQLMPVGSKYRVVLPPELAYGDQGAGDVIAPNSVLVFEIELIDIEAPAPADSAAAPADSKAAGADATAK